MHADGRTERSALLWLTVGSFLPIVGWLIGVRTAWSSTAWQSKDKVVAALAFPGGPFVALIVAWWLAHKTGVSCTSGLSGSSRTLDGPPTSITVIARTCTQPDLNVSVGLVLVTLVVGTAIGGPLYLWRQARARTRSSQR